MSDRLILLLIPSRVLSAVDQSQTCCPFHPLISTNANPDPTYSSNQKLSQFHSIRVHSVHLAKRSFSGLVPRKRSYWPIKPNLLRPAQQHNKQQNIWYSHQSNSPYVNPNLLRVSTTTLFYTGHSHQENPTVNQTYSVCRPGHCFTLDIAIKRTVSMSTQKTSPCIDHNIVSHFTQPPREQYLCQPQNCSVYDHDTVSRLT